MEDQKMTAGTGCKCKLCRARHLIAEAQRLEAEVNSAGEKPELFLLVFAASATAVANGVDAETFLRLAAAGFAHAKASLGPAMEREAAAPRGPIRGLH